MSASPLTFQIPQYEGPLDLLLDLIRKQQMNIYDIPLAQITAQYLEYMQKAVALDIELGSEFVFMAATLIYIKSRTLLPRDPELEKMTDEGDPRQELVERLVQHEQFKNAAEMLQQKLVVEEAIWSNPQIEQFRDDEGPAIAATIFELVRTFQLVLERAKTRPTFEVDPDESTVPEMMHFLRGRLARMDASQALSAMELFDSQRSERAMICLFLAILELVKRQSIRLTQGEAFGDIALLRGHSFNDEPAAGELMSVEGEYS